MTRLKSPALNDLAERRWGHHSKWRCSYCGRSIPDGSVDHFIPRARGGTDLPWNLVPVCGPCNSSKKHRATFEWMDAVGVPPSTISALRAITQSPDWSQTKDGPWHPSPAYLDYSGAANLWETPPPFSLPTDLDEWFDMDPNAWSPVTAIRRVAAGHLRRAGRPVLSAQQINRDLASRGLARTARKGVWGYRGFYVVPELAKAGRLTAGIKATTAARRAEREVRVPYALMKVEREGY